MKANYHTHTARCGHATGTDEQYVEAAIGQRFNVLGFSDHVPWPYASGFTHRHVRMGIEQLDEYVSSMRTLKQRYAGSIASAIVRRREDKPVETTLELVDIIKSAMPAKALKEKQHPAKRSFQAIRIAVNDELGAVERMLQTAVPRLNLGGRLAVITFHSLEDRIVKTGLAGFAKGCT